MPRTLFTKMSGETFNEGAQDGEAYTRKGIDHLVSSAQALHDARDDLGLAGIVFVPGGGNLVRGRETVQQGVPRDIADIAGCIGLVSNAVVLGRAMEDAGIPTRTMLTPNMRFSHPSMGDMELATPHAIQDAHTKGQIPVIGGGSGKPEQSTDTAVLDHLLAYKQVFPGEFVVTKGTEHVVHDKDPVQYPDARPLQQVSANLMLSNPHLLAVDEQTARLLDGSGIDMLIYPKEMDPVQALVHEVGTTILSAPDVLEYARAPFEA